MGGRGPPAANLHRRQYASSLDLAGSLNVYLWSGLRSDRLVAKMALAPCGLVTAGRRLAIVERVVTVVDDDTGVNTGT